MSGVDALARPLNVGIIGAGNLMNASAGFGQQLQKQIGQTGVPVYNVANACATGATALRTAIMAVKAGETDVGLAVARAYLDLDGALRVLPGLQAAVDAARANQAQADARFRAGLGTIVELADAEALLTSSQLERAVGHFAVARARATLGRVMGHPFERAKP